MKFPNPMACADSLRRGSNRVLPIGAALFALTAATSAWAQSPAAAPTSNNSAVAPAPGVQIDSVRLLELLVKNGMVTREQADGLLAQAAVPNTPAVPALPAPAPGTQRVAYVPAPLRAQIKEELHAEIVQQAKDEGWAQPGALPEWTQRLTFSGDVRARAENVAFGDNTDANGFPFPFPDFDVINAGSGFDVNGLVNAPFVNVTENRNRARLRARLALHARISDWVSADLRLATGQDRGPVSTNQTLGAGGTGLYNIWLDRAGIQLTLADGFAVDAGRFANPFWTSPALFDDDLNFDGLAATYDHPISDSIEVFAAGGGFPLFNTAFDVGATDLVKTESRDKYLLALQLGARWTPGDDFKLTGSAGVFDFVDIEGARSSPCLAPTADDTCDTDLSRPSFTQFGNTMFALRDIVPDPSDPTGPQRQYFGLASEFKVMALRGQIELTRFDAFPFRLEGEYLRNLAWNRNDIAARGPVNNLSGDVPQTYDGGDKAWMAALVAGAPQLVKRGDWSVSVGYRYIESDAVPDAFNDSDFHLGGTNAQGFVVGGGLGIAPNTALNLRWLSANEITGAPYEVDVLQLDLNTAF